MPMVIGVLQVELEIDDPESLKDKRRIINSIKDRLHHEHMVSVAEIASQDNPRLATLGVALAASDTRYAQSVLQRILNKLKTRHDCVLSDHDLRVITGETRDDTDASNDQADDADEPSK